MYTKILVATASLAVLVSSDVQAQAATDAAGSVPLSRLIEMAAKKSSKKFVVDPRVKADVSLIGQDPASVSYGEFLTILQLHGFAAVEGGGYVGIIPDASVRSHAVPHMTGRETYPDAQYVTKSILVKNMPAVSLVPVLRPLLPQQSHLAAISCSNLLIIMDTMANVRRIEDIVRSVDTGDAYQPPKCDASSAAAPRSPANKES